MENNANWVALILVIAIIQILTALFSDNLYKILVTKCSLGKVPYL